MVISRTLLFFAIALLVEGCVRVITQQKTLDTPLATKDGPPIPTTPEVKVNHEFTANQLVVSIQEQPRCTVEKFQVVDRTTDTERKAESKNVLYSEYSLAAVIAGAGAIFLGLADSCGKNNGPGEENEGLTPDKCRGAGYASFGVAGIALGVAIWETFRLRDSTEHVGKTEIPKGTSTTNCGELRPATGKVVSLSFGSGFALKQTSNALGRVVFTYPPDRPLPIESDPSLAAISVSSLPPIAVDASRIVPHDVLAAREAMRVQREKDQAQKAAEESRRAQLRRIGACRSLCAKFKDCTNFGMDRGTCWSMNIAGLARELGLSDVTDSWQGLDVRCDTSCQRLEAQLKTDGSVCLDRDPRCVRGLSLMQKSEAIINGLSGQSPATQVRLLREADRLLSEAQQLVCETAPSAPPCLRIPATRKQIRAAIGRLEQHQ